MNLDRSVDERITAWLRDEAPDQLPDRVLRATFERTSSARQDRTILRRRFSPMRISAAIAVGATAVVLLLGGVALLPRQGPSVGTEPTPTPSPTPTASPGAFASPTLVPVSLAGQIAFQRMVDDNTDIYLMNLDRSGLQRLTDAPTMDTNPGWSPDGERLVFTRNVGGTRHLFVMNADGSGQTQLTDAAENDDDGRFSPDGGSIAYWRGTDQASSLRVMDADGSNDRVILELTDTFGGGVAWTPDGTAILSNRDLSGGGGIDIVRIDIASGELTPITDFAGDDSSFALSPDGTTVAFQSDRAPGGIFLMDIDGTNVRHVTGTWDKGYPVTWSPDGDHLAYAQPDGWIYLVRTDGTEVTKWAQGGLNLAWRPAP